MAYKVKRHKKIYRRNRSRRFSPLHIFLTILIAGVVFFVGWSVYQPVVDFITGKTPVPEGTSSTSVPVSDAGSSSEASQTSQPDNTSENTDASKSAYLPVDVLKDSARLDSFLSSLEGSQINAVVVDLKDETGILHYTSKNAQAVSADAVASDAVDLSAVLKKLKEHGIELIARVNAFRDHTMPYANADMAVRYQSEGGTLWLDDYYENGGKAWLNPYASSSQQYITDLLNELAAAGVKQFLLDGVQFPEGVGLNLAYYPGSGSKSQQQALSDFIGAVQTAMEEKNCKVSVYLPAEAFIGDGLTQYGGNAKGITLDAVTVDLRPSEFDSDVEIGGTKLTDPVSKPYESVRTILGAVKASLGSSAAITGVIQSDGYTTAEISDEIKALNEQDVTDYLLLSEDGSYSFEGSKTSTAP